MALTPFRWIALAAIGCMLALLAVVSVVEKQYSYLGPRRSRDDIDTTGSRLREISGGLNQRAQTLAGRYRLLFLMDSVKRVASRLPDTGAYRIFISDTYDPEMRAVIERAIRNARGARSGEAGRVDIFVVNDTLQFVRGVPRYPPTSEVRYEMPATAGTRCRVFVRTAAMQAFSRRRYARESLLSGYATQQLLGPCGFFAAFGEPGPFVRQWMVNVGWQYALGGSWTLPPVTRPLPQDAGIFKGVSPALGVLNLSAGGPACIKGDLDVCERAMTAAVVTSRTRQRIAGATYSQSLGYRRYFQSGLGTLGGELLSDATRELGRERFRAFWTSPDSVNVAFQKSTGQRWGEYIRRWMISRYGAIEAGPRASGFAIGVSALFVLVALVVTMIVSVRREYA